MTLFAVVQAGAVPAAAPRAAVVLLLARSLPGDDGGLAELQERAALGRGRGRDLLHGVAALLVPRASFPIWRRCATARPVARGAIVYGVFALGWRGSARHWQQYRIAYGLLAGLATPLVVSVHSIVSLGLRDHAASRAGTRRSSRRTSWRARSSPASRWC